MPGVRITHPTRRGLVTVEDGTRPYFRDGQVAPYLCPTCPGDPPVEHKFKTYHLQLDGEGSAIVSPDIWVIAMKALLAAGFTFSNPVAKPPAQVIGVNAPPLVFGGGSKR